MKAFAPSVPEPAVLRIVESRCAVLAKVGLKGVDSNLATAIRTVVILVLAWGIVYFRGGLADVDTLSRTNLLFLGLSGLATGLSWVFYFRALQLGQVSQVAPVDKLSVSLEVSGFGTLTVDTAYGGDSFVIVDATALGFEVRPDEAREIAEAGVKITAAANEQLGFTHPENAGWDHISFCQITGPLARENGVLTGANAVVIQPGKIDRGVAQTAVYLIRPTTSTSLRPSRTEAG